MLLMLDVAEMLAQGTTFWPVYAVRVHTASFFQLYFTQLWFVAQPRVSCVYKANYIEIFTCIGHMRKLWRCSATRTYIHKRTALCIARISQPSIGVVLREVVTKLKIRRSFRGEFRLIRYIGMSHMCSRHTKTKQPTTLYYVSILFV